MIKFKTHFCLVSAQAAPNLLPLLDDTVKPEKVVFLVTQQMKKQADYLEQVIKPKGIVVQRVELTAIDNFEKIQEQLMALLEQEDAKNIALNVTGGTKWMAIAAQEVFRMNGSAVFYVDLSQDKLLFLDSTIPAHQLSQRISLKNYIESYGYEFRGENQPIGLKVERKELCRELIFNVERWQSAIGLLNKLAAKAEEQNTLQVDYVKESSLPYGFEQLLFECEKAKLLTVKDKQLSFIDAQARNFANGGWLEYHVNNLLNELKADGIIQDSARLNLEIHRQGETSHNELDVCFMARNRLHIIECKTKRMSGKNSPQTTDTIYKLDSISELGGLSSKAMLVSYRAIDKTADKQRAKDLRIKVIAADQLKTLKSALKQWIESN